MSNNLFWIVATDHPIADSLHRLCLDLTQLQFFSQCQQTEHFYQFFTRYSFISQTDVFVLEDSTLFLYDLKDFELSQGFYEDWQRHQFTVLKLLLEIVENCLDTVCRFAFF